MELGIDISTYFEVLDNNKHFYIDGIIVDPLDEFKKQGVKSLRIRLWNNPYSSDGKKYLGGTCDLNNFIKLAKLGLEKGFDILLDIHYSDFWADPHKQVKPKEWNNLHDKELIKAVYHYTLDTLKEIKNNGIDLKMVQIGNEITNGMLWPDGKLEEQENSERTNYEYFSSLLKAGIKAVDEIYPSAKKMLHLEKSFDNITYTEFLQNMAKFGVNFDVLGVSYYPSWHGTFADLFKNLDKCKKEFNKEISIVETSYPFTLEDYLNCSESIFDKIIAPNKETLSKYPLTKEGQKEYLKDLMLESKKHGISELYYWEPLWLPGQNICWASTFGQEYINEQNRPTRNEWANQALFDYEGNANPAFFEYKRTK